jgi:hypothetical protein
MGNTQRVDNWGDTTNHDCGFIFNYQYVMGFTWCPGEATPPDVVGGKVIEIQILGRLIFGLFPRNVCE